MFASEVKALLSLPQVPGCINEARIADYLVSELEGIDKTCTFYQEIFRLPPAHSATVSPDKAFFQTYWAPDPTREVHYASNEEYAEAFREIFTEAVRCRLRCHGPAASMLSGGLDSSSIVGVARKLLLNNEADSLHTLSAISEDDANSPETEAINAIIRTGGIKAHSIRPAQYRAAIIDGCYILKNTDDLFDADLMGIPLLVYSTARKNGIKVVLDGVPGDNVVSQDPKCLAYLLRAGQWKTAMIEAGGFGRLYHISPAKLLWSHLKLAFIPHSWRKLRCALNHKNRFDLAIDDAIINPDFARRIRLTERLDTLHGTRWFTTPLNSLREDHWNDLHHPYITVALERYGRVAAAHSIEARHPFIDKRLVEFCLALPWEQKVHQGWSKIVLRRAMAGYLPEEVRWRPDKEDLVNEFGRPWFASTQKLMEEVITHHLERINEYININACLKAYHRYRTQGTLDDAYKVWQAVTLALWLNGSQLLSD